MATVVGCDQSGTGESPVLVMAAASLNTVMPELVATFVAEGGSGVDVVLASTGNLAAQIENGAPGDVFLSADRATVERLAADGYLLDATITVYANGGLVLIWRDGLEAPTSFSEIVDSTYGVIAIANPEHAPYGIAAREALSGAGILEVVSDRIVYAENIGQAYQFVRTGNADAGLVARSVLQDQSEPHLPIDATLHAPIEHEAAILASSNNASAQAFLTFLTSDAGQAILARHGF